MDYIDFDDGRSKPKAVLLTLKKIKMSSASLHVAAFMMSSAFIEWNRWFYLYYIKIKRAVLQVARRYNFLQKL
jgi:hypothetical protein